MKNQSEAPACKNCGRPNFYGTKYGGYCLDCWNARAPEHEDEIAVLRARVASLEKAREDICNSATFDTTDGACPAWWRGCDHGWAKGQKRIAELEGLLQVFAQTSTPKPSPTEEYNLWCGCTPSRQVCLRGERWLHYAGATPCPTGTRYRQRGYCGYHEERRMTDRRTGLFYGRRDYGGRRSGQNRKGQRRLALCSKRTSAGWL